MIEGNELVIVGGRGWEDEADVLGMRFPVPGENPNSAVIQTGKPYYLADAGKVYEKFSEPPHDHIRSWLGVPLIVQGRLTGLLAIDSAQPGNFDEEKINIALELKPGCGRARKRPALPRKPDPGDHRRA